MRKLQKEEKIVGKRSRLRKTGLGLEERIERSKRRKVREKEKRRREEKKLAEAIDELVVTHPGIIGVPELLAPKKDKDWLRFEP